MVINDISIDYTLSKQGRWKQKITDYDSNSKIIAERRME
jgi:hypothetical protein